jgi:hypothetical protein
MTNPHIDEKVVKVLMERFVLTHEQATELFLAYHLGGCCEDVVEAVYKMDEKVMFGVGKDIIRQVFIALDDLYHNPEYRKGVPSEDN